MDSHTPGCQCVTKFVKVRQSASKLIKDAKNDDFQISANKFGKKFEKIFGKIFGKNFQKNFQKIFSKKF